MKTIQHWISGSVTAGASTRTGPVWNPANREQQAQVLLAERADVDHAVATAAKALCADCPAQLACLAGAIDRREPFGVWGGPMTAAS